MNDHKSGEQLLKEIDEANKQIDLGTTYVHYKSADMLYKPLHFAVLEATNELCVVYQALYGERLLFVRPVSVWLETVEWEGQTVPRFAPVEK